MSTGATPVTLGFPAATASALPGSAASTAPPVIPGFPAAIRSEPVNPSGTMVACDLDRTLIYSASAFWLETEDTDAPPIVVSELFRGVPLSFMTREAERMLRELAAATPFVPVTTRTVAQYQRVQLPSAVPGYAVTSNGGVILTDGTPDEDWRQSVAGRLTAEAAPLAEIEVLLSDPAASAWILRVNNAEDLFLYAIVDRAEMPADWAAQLQADCAALGWTVSVQGRKLYCVPKPVTKSAALAEVQRRLGAETLIAAGDSLLDQPMLEMATIAFRPAHGELDEVGYTAANLTVTTTRGILAGEDLVRLITAAVLEGAVAHV
jgi:hydroxymethylpyrimidine pyrophosphatase-like HAD family hydrolase